MYCSNCGCELPQNAKFCGKCGTTVKQNSVRDEMKSGNQNGQPVFQNPQEFPVNNGMPNAAHVAGSVTGGVAHVDGSVAGGVAHATGNVAGGVVRQAGKAKRNMLLALLVVGVFAIFFLLYTVFLKTGTPEDTIAKLEKGMNNLDQEMVLECFDDQMNSLYSGSLGLLDSLSGLPISDLADVASGLGGLLSASGMTPTVSIDIDEIEYSADKKSCMAYVLFEMEYMGESQSEYMEIPMVLDGREWLISMSDLSSFYY